MNIREKLSQVKQSIGLSPKKTTETVLPEKKAVFEYDNGYYTKASIRRDENDTVVANVKNQLLSLGIASHDDGSTDYLVTDTEQYGFRGMINVTGNQVTVDSPDEGKFATAIPENLAKEKDPLKLLENIYKHFEETNQGSSYLSSSASGIVNIANDIPEFSKTLNKEIKTRNTEKAMTMYAARAKMFSK